MGLTLRHLLSLPSLRQARVVVGEAWLDRDVSGVGVIEVPVEGFVRPGELVLTTAMDVGRRPRRMAAFVREVAVAGASGLALSVGAHATPLARPARDVAAEHGLVVLELPWSLRFSEITEAVLRRLLHAHHDDRRREDLLWVWVQGALETQRAVTLAADLGFSWHSGGRVLVGLASDLPGLDWARAVRGTAALRGWSVLTAAAGRELLMLVGPVHWPALEDRLADLERHSGVPATWGVSRAGQQPGDVPQQHAEARQAALLGLDTGRRLMRAEDLALDQLLSRMRGLPETTALQSRYLTPLGRSAIPLRETLVAYFEAQGDVSKAARQLGIHRQTLRHRLARAEALLELSLADPAQRQALELALRLGGRAPR